jgi:hypothetical protein
VIGLINLLLEESPSQMAARLGLERKPGFGNYGPKGSDAITHRSRGGKLLAVSDTTTSGDSPAQQTSPVDDSLGEYIADFTAKAFGGKTGITPSSLVEATSVLFGNSKPIKKIGTFEEITDRRTAVEFTMGGCMGVYNTFTHTIGLPPASLRRFAHLAKTPVSEWERVDAELVNTMVHESIHAACPRLNGTMNNEDVHTYGNMAVAMAFEEGITEYMSQQISAATLQSQGYAGQMPGSGYTSEVQMIKWMVEYGDLDVYDTQTLSYPDLLERCTEAHHKAVGGLLRDLKFSETDIKYAMESSRFALDQAIEFPSVGFLLLTNSYLVSRLEFLINRKDAVQDGERTSFIKVLPDPNPPEIDIAPTG